MGSSLIHPSTVTFASLVGSFADVVNSLVLLLSGVAMAIFFWGIAKFMLQAGDREGRSKGKEMIVWGLVGMFVIFSLGGILKFLQIAFLGQTNF